MAETNCNESDKRAQLRYLQRLFIANGYRRNFIQRNRQAKPRQNLVAEQQKVWRALPYIDDVAEAVSNLLRTLGIGITHRPDSTIRNLVRRPKEPPPRGETSNVIYQIQCDACEFNYVVEAGKRLQTRVAKHAWTVRRMDPLILVAEHCANSGHTFTFRNTEILVRVNDRVTREKIIAWDTETTLINHFVALPAAYLVLRAQLIERKSKYKIRPNVNPTTVEPRTDMHLTTPQSRADECAFINSAASITTATDEETYCQKDKNRTSSPGHQLRSMRSWARASNCQTLTLVERHAN
ncbi:unnamed protein product [Schistocephalus solidus]|uniref:Uncharacterized protein n=1 Tax=Schistocephalus solidus TaxID=70667 RepID=A0A183T0I8_SCHSO|nr:unnamed protein product [Schistocephalus solidus]